MAMDSKQDFLRNVERSLSYWIRSGCFEGMLMCNAKEANLARNEDYSDKLIGECLVDEFMDKRPKDCPIVDGEFPKFCRHCGKAVKWDE